MVTGFTRTRAIVVLASLTCLTAVILCRWIVSPSLLLQESIAVGNKGLKTPMLTFPGIGDTEDTDEAVRAAYAVFKMPGAIYDDHGYGNYGGYSGYGSNGDGYGGHRGRFVWREPGGIDAGHYAEASAIVGTHTAATSFADDAADTAAAESAFGAGRGDYIQGAGEDEGYVVTSGRVTHGGGHDDSYWYWTEDPEEFIDDAAHAHVVPDSGDEVYVEGDSYYWPEYEDQEYWVEGGRRGGGVAVAAPAAASGAVAVAAGGGAGTRRRRAAGDADFGVPKRLPGEGHPPSVEWAAVPAGKQLYLWEASMEGSYLPARPELTGEGTKQINLIGPPFRHPYTDENNLGGIPGDQPANVLSGYR